MFRLGNAADRCKVSLTVSVHSAFGCLQTCWKYQFNLVDFHLVFQPRSPSTPNVSCSLYNTFDEIFTGLSVDSTIFFFSPSDLINNMRFGIWWGSCQNQIPLILILTQHSICWRSSALSTFIFFNMGWIKAGGVSILGFKDQFGFWQWWLMLVSLLPSWILNYGLWVGGYGSECLDLK